MTHLLVIRVLILKLYHYHPKIYFIKYGNINSTKSEESLNACSNLDFVTDGPSLLIVASNKFYHINNKSIVYKYNQYVTLSSDKFQELSLFFQLILNSLLFIFNK